MNTETMQKRHLGSLSNGIQPKTKNEQSIDCTRVTLDAIIEELQSIDKEMADLLYKDRPE